MLSMDPNKTQKFVPRMSYAEYIELLNYIGLGLKNFPKVEAAPIKFPTSPGNEALAKFDQIIDYDFDTELLLLSEGEIALEELEQELAGKPKW